MNILIVIMAIITATSIIVFYPQDDINEIKTFSKKTTFPILDNVTYTSGASLQYYTSNIPTEELIIQEWDNISEQDRLRIINELSAMGFVEQPSQQIILENIREENINSTRSNVS